jgi:hypothetical protein
MELDSTDTHKVVGTARQAMQLPELEVYRNDLTACDIKFRGTQGFIDVIVKQLTGNGDLM